MSVDSLALVLLCSLWAAALPTAAAVTTVSSPLDGTSEPEVGETEATEAGTPSPSWTYK